MVTKKIAAPFFANHPQATSFFFTSDGQAFHTENDALNHQKALAYNKGGKGTVVELTRAEFEAMPDNGAMAESQPGTPGDGSQVNAGVVIPPVANEAVPVKIGNAGSKKAANTKK